MVAVKLIPNLFVWIGIVLVLFRGFLGSRPTLAAASSAGFVAGVGGAFLLSRSFPEEVLFGIIRDAVGASFLLLWGVSVAAIYRSTVRDFPLSWGARVVASPVFSGAGTFMAGTMAGAICACRVSSVNGNVPAFFLLTLAAVALVFVALAADKLLPKSLTVSHAGLMASVVAFLLFSSSFILRLDLFSPLTMKVMKFTHDFVHQFFESMLIPDHGFIRSRLWGYIGLLFSSGVGFWGGLVIWFTPVVLVLLAIQFERLPAVAHIRQGAQRRKLIATAIKARRFRLVVPLISVGFLAASVYQSRFPSVEYWDPKPVPVSASPSGEIFIPKKGEVDLEDGKLHKYLFKQGGVEARFFVLKTPAGKLTVDLDACAICKPDGYGQAEGTVICYYCKTLIPLETVGKPGGCNPVPAPFSVKDDGIHMDSISLINLWSTTVQATARVKEGGK